MCIRDSGVPVHGRQQLARAAVYGLLALEGLSLIHILAGLPTDTAGGFSRTLDAVLSLAPEDVTCLLYTSRCV